MDNIERLEREYVAVYSDLLRALDELYLMQRRHSQDFSKDEQEQLALRSQMQLSLSKTASMLKTLQIVAEDDLEGFKSGENGVFASDAAAPVTSEQFLARRLQKLMQDNYELDKMLSSSMSRELNAYDELVDQREEFQDLLHRFRELCAQFDEKCQKDNPRTNDNNDERLIRENETIQELLLALKIHGGYGI